MEKKEIKKEYSIDEEKIKAALKTQGKHLKIPGIEIYKEIGKEIEDHISFVDMIKQDLVADPKTALEHSVAMGKVLELMVETDHFQGVLNKRVELLNERIIDILKEDKNIKR